MSERFKHVQDVLENYKSAIYEKDIERFISAYASDVHVYDCWAKWEYAGISQWKEAIKDWFDGLIEEGASVKTDFNDLVVEENSILAFVHCAVTFAACDKSGDPFRQMKNRFTFCLRKENESWVITHEHSSLPINIETGKSISEVK